MPHIVVKDDPYKGRYEFDPSFNMAEMHTIKRISGLRGAEIWDGFKAGDTDLRVAFAVIALERAGHEVDESFLWKKDVSGIQLDLGSGGEEEEKLPPAPAAGSTPSSGGDSTASSDPQGSGPSATGGQPSDTSATSAPKTSDS